jgi:hypothetical protein
VATARLRRCLCLHGRRPSSGHVRATSLDRLLRAALGPQWGGAIARSGRNSGKPDVTTSDKTPYRYQILAQSHAQARGASGGHRNQKKCDGSGNTMDRSCCLERTWVHRPTKKSRRGHTRSSEAAGGNRFPAKKPGGRNVWHLLPRAGVKDQARYEGTIEDERRLFYVAMTRSQKFLHLTWAPVSGNQLFQNRSVFWDDVLASKRVKNRAVLYLAPGVPHRRAFRRRPHAGGAVHRHDASTSRAAEIRSGLPRCRARRDRARRPCADGAVTAVHNYPNACASRFFGSSNTIADGSNASGSNGPPCHRSSSLCRGCLAFDSASRNSA